MRGTMTRKWINRMKKLTLFLLCLLLMTGCASTPSPAAAATPDPSVKTTGVGFYFDTVVTVTFYGAEEGALEDLWALCSRYENLLSKTIPTSDVSRINAAGGQPVTVDPETWEILRRAKDISAMTDGAFSVTIAPISAMWDFTGGTNRMPTEEARIAALPLVDDQKITLGEGNTVTLPAGMMIDLGGIAKGYIADAAAEMLKDRVYGAALSFGGNVYVLGNKPDGSVFRVGLQDPGKMTGIYMAVVGTKDNSIVTSGTYERFFEVDGVRYHHILDPRTGLSSTSDLSSATFIMTSSMDADALATACIVRGSEWSMNFAKQHDLDAVFITTDGKVLVTEGFTDTHAFTLMN